MELQDFFHEHPKAALGFSGGVDSSYLLWAARQCGADVRPYYIKTAFQPEFEFEDAKRLCREIGADLTVLELDALSDPAVAANLADRCYHCKRNLFGTLAARALADGYTLLLDGTNASDDAGDRPGMRALRELSVRSPLRECGLTKARIRALSREAGLFTWDKPAYACLATRVPTGETITAEKLVVLRTHGVTRVSVNPQTFEENVLRAIGRCHTAADIDRAMELVARCGFPHVNMDLIAGLPEDTAEGFRRSLDRCLTYGPDDITVHTLALKKGSRILTEGLRIPGAETVAEMLDYASPTLRTAGYRPYYLYRQKYMSGSFENIGWCRSGGECWYNVDIMSELCSILSFGAAGSTKMVVPGTNQIQRAFNVKYPTEYIQRPEKWQANQTAFAAFYEAL